MTVYPSQPGTHHGPRGMPSAHSEVGEGMADASTARRSDDAGEVWEKAARAGYAVSGVLHVILGFLIARIPLGSGGEEASQSSAIASLGDAPLGSVLLWVAVAAFVALGTWQAADALRGGSDAKDRAKAAAKAVVYLALAFTTVTIVTGSGGSGGEGQAEGFASTLMQAPGGRLLVGAVGLGVLAAGGFHVYKGVTRRFERDLRSTPTPVGVLGVVGYAAKGIALGAVGILFGYAAVTADPDKAAGIDGALESLLGAPAGPAIVVVVGVGFAAYGLYSLARARYARM